MQVATAVPVIPVSYFLRIPNFGDRLNPEIVEAVSGRQGVWCRDRARTHLLAIGSLMADATANSHVWGTGVMHPEFGFGGVQGARIHALRGQLSASTLKASGIALADVPLGDPAILAPQLLGIYAQKAPRYRVGVVAHYVDRQHPAIRAMLREEGVCDINVHADPGEVVRAIANCGSILSSSLHGLVLAEALGLPNLWIRASDETDCDFRFQDWYSTTRYPQKQAHCLRDEDTALALSALAEPRTTSVDIKALITAFPRTVEWDDSPCRSWMPVRECRLAPLPVILISFNRGRMLRRVIAGLGGLDKSIEVIIHDNGSNDPETIAILSELEIAGIAVHRRPPIAEADELNQVNETVAKIFENRAEPGCYVVSDCDIDIALAEPDIFDVFASLLNQWGRAECVGPMLRISDIPETYPLRNRALNRHIEQFWRHQPTIISVEGRPVAIQEALIDTSLAMHRAGEEFRRLKPGLRTYEPYEAVHLDWYIDQRRATPEAKMYAHTSNSRISHWNNVTETAMHSDDELEYEHFFAIRQLCNGDLESYVIVL